MTSIASPSAANPPSIRPRWAGLSLILVLVWRTALAAGADPSLSPPVTLAEALARMDAHTDLAYEQITRRERAESRERVWWRLREGLRSMRMDSPTGVEATPIQTTLWDGKTKLTTHPGFGIRILHPGQVPRGLADYYFHSRDSNYLAQAVATSDTFAGVATLRISRPWKAAESVPLPGFPNFDGERRDHVDVATGFWIGYEILDAQGASRHALILEEIRTDPIPDTVFQIPIPGLRIRDVDGDADFAPAMIAEMGGGLRPTPQAVASIRATFKRLAMTVGATLLLACAGIALYLGRQHRRQRHR